MGFQKAVKGNKPLRMVFGGPSGSGKTFTALKMAKFLEDGYSHKPTAAIDTEYYRMSVYADQFDFDVENRVDDFDPRWLVDKIHEAEKEGYGQLIIDSSTHFYSSTGGLLEIVSDAAKSKFGNNVYAGWSVGTPVQNKLVETIIRSPMHVLFCIRAKQAYSETEKNGKKTYEKVGMELIQRDGIEYDFDFAIMMDMDNTGTITKGMGLVPPGTYFKKPDEKCFEKIMKSLTDNMVEKSAIPESNTNIIENTKEKLGELVKSLGGSKNKDLMKILKSYVSSGNYTKIDELDKLQKCFEEVAKLTVKEN